MAISLFGLISVDAPAFGHRGMFMAKEKGNSKQRKIRAPKEKIKFRLNVMVSLCALAFVVYIIINLFKVSVLNSAQYQSYANAYQFSTISISAKRGTIYDASGAILAQSATVFKVYVDPTMFAERDKDKEELLTKQLCDFLELEQDFVTRKLHNEKSQYEILKTKVEKPLKDEISKFTSDNGIACVFFEEDTKRYYPQNELAAAVIGFTNADGAGQYGVEYQYDSYLAGIDGRVLSAKDANGEEMPYKYTKLFEAQDGNDVHLTIDSTLQYYVEKHLADVIETQKVEERACAIMMNAKTGAILAMATCNGFDLNNPSKIMDKNVQAYLSTLSGDEYTAAYIAEREKQWKNKCITELYYPGSVFKVITGAAAIEEKAMTMTDTFRCGDTVVSGTHFHCWTSTGHGIQNFYEALLNSCNPAFIEMARRMGSETFYTYFEAFGLTGRTGIDLPFEATSIYQGLQGMGPVELASCSFGQTNKVTPIEMVTAYAAVINGGYLLTPYVVDKVVDSDGNVILDNEANIVRQVISAETSAQMRDALENVVSVKGGSNAYIKGFRIGGKSGTSQKQDENNKQGRDDLYADSYCCFFPANDPEIIMLVMVDQPMAGDYYASIVVVPTVREILEDALPYLGYYPEYNDEEMLSLDITVPQLEDKPAANAQTTLTELGLVAEVVGDGEKVIKQVPDFGSMMPSGGKVILYTETDQTVMTEVPNVTNLSLDAANKALTAAGLNYSASGASLRTDAVVLEQSITAGESVPKGTVVKLTFAVYDQSG